MNKATLIGKCWIFCAQYQARFLPKWCQADESSPKKNKHRLNYICNLNVKQIVEHSQYPQLAACMPCGKNHPNSASFEGLKYSGAELGRLNWGKKFSGHVGKICREFSGSTCQPGPCKQKIWRAPQIWKRKLTWTSCSNTCWFQILNKLNNQFWSLNSSVGPWKIHWSILTKSPSS